MERRTRRPLHRPLRRRRRLVRSPRLRPAQRIPRRRSSHRFAFVQSEAGCRLQGIRLRIRQRRNLRRPSRQLVAQPRPRGRRASHCRRRRGEAVRNRAGHDDPAARSAPRPFCRRTSDARQAEASPAGVRHGRAVDRRDDSAERGNPRRAHRRHRRVRLRRPTAGDHFGRVFGRRAARQPRVSPRRLDGAPGGRGGTGRPEPLHRGVCGF